MRPVDYLQMLIGVKEDENRSPKVQVSLASVGLLSFQGDVGVG